MKVQRYDWLDALVEAQARGLIPNGALLLCVKLSKAINWVPDDKRPSGLYWKNEEALKSVGASRANYFKHRKVLFDLGFFTEKSGNLLPQVPDLSLLETDESLLETTESPLETEQSLLEHPYSEDIYSEDVLSEENTVTVAGATVLEEAVQVETLPKPSESSKVLVPPISTNSTSGEATSGDSPPVSTRDWKTRREWAASFGETPEQTARRKQLASASIGDDW